MSTKIATNGIISVIVVGTNEATRQTKTIDEKFNLKGELLDANGAVVVNAPGLILNFDDTTPEPVFDNEALKLAASQGDKLQMDTLLSGFADAMEEWQKSSNGGSIELQLAKAVHQYCINVHGFLNEDGDGYVLPIKNLNVSTNVGETTTVYVVAGTAVFGMAA